MLVDSSYNVLRNHGDANFNLNLVSANDMQAMVQLYGNA